MQNPNLDAIHDMARPSCGSALAFDHLETWGKRDREK
jgi:hypothetical protein